MRKRYKLSRRSSRRYFTKGANLTHKSNLYGAKYMMRGGIRK